MLVDGPASDTHSSLYTLPKNGVKTLVRRLKANPLLLDLYMLNPLVTLISAFRDWMLEPIFLEKWNITAASQVPAGYLLLTVITSTLVAIGGYALFNRMKWSFVERP